MNSHNSKLLHTLGNKEEKLSAFLDTGQRNKGEKKTNKRREEKRNLTLIMGYLLTKRDIRKKNFFPNVPFLVFLTHYKSEGIFI